MGFPDRLWISAILLTTTATTVCRAFPTTPVPVTATVTPDLRCRELLHQALEAQGGEAKLRALKNVAWEAHGYRHLVEQSERPEGPYVDEFLHVTEIHDLHGGRFRSSIEGTIYPQSRSHQPLSSAVTQPFSRHQVATIRALRSWCRSFTSGWP